MIYFCHCDFILFSSQGCKTIRHQLTGVRVEELESTTNIVAANAPPAPPSPSRSCDASFSIKVLRLQKGSDPIGKTNPQRCPASPQAGRSENPLANQHQRVCGGHLATDPSCLRRIWVSRTIAGACWGASRIAPRSGSTVTSIGPIPFEHLYVGDRPRDTLCFGEESRGGVGGQIPALQGPERGFETGRPLARPLCKARGALLMPSTAPDPGTAPGRKSPGPFPNMLHSPVCPLAFWDVLFIRAGFLLPAGGQRPHAFPVFLTSVSPGKWVGGAGA